MELQIKGLCLLLLVVPLAGLAQDEASEAASASDATEIDSIEPAVSSEDLNEPTDEIGPAVSTSTLAPDVRRSNTGTTVMDSLDLGRTEITGNQELPKVLYIVPWQRSSPGELMGRPVNTLLNEVLAPINRSEFVREVDYYDDLYRNEE
jgi:hypothetical protein